MSGSSYNDSRSRAGDYEVFSSTSATPTAYRTAWEARRERVVDSRERVARGEVKAPPRVARDEAQVRDPSLVRLRITRPSPAARRAVVVLVDNSGSNRTIAEHLRRSSGHFAAMARLADPGAEVAFIYFSDHCDGNLLSQPVDFVTADEKGDRQLFSSLEHVQPANGGDAPEAIECALADAAEVDFAGVPREARTLILVTDVCPHGMPEYKAAFPGEPDEGCPRQRSWRSSMAAVRATYGEFVVIGSGADPAYRALQQKLFETAPGVSDPDEVAVNFLDFSSIRASAHRNGLVGNAIGFVLARRAGKQAVVAYLAALYEKWIASPIFGTDTDAKARERIASFANLYLRRLMTPAETENLLRDVFAD